MRNEKARLGACRVSSSSPQPRGPPRSSASRQPLPCGGARRGDRGPPPRRPSQGRSRRSPPSCALPSRPTPHRRPAGPIVRPPGPQARRAGSAGSPAAPWNPARWRRSEPSFEVACGLRVHLVGDQHFGSLQTSSKPLRPDLRGRPHSLETRIRRRPPSTAMATRLPCSDSPRHGALHRRGRGCAPWVQPKSARSDPPPGSSPGRCQRGRGGPRRRAGDPG